MYVIGRDGLQRLEETPYERELDLQAILADHPALLGGDQMDRAAPRRFVLITREAGIAVADGGGAIFALDLLYADQDAVPTLVEVKRSSDTRLRREVIGQILEYAANICAFWSGEKLRAAFEQRCTKEGLEPQALLQQALSVQLGDYENYWAMAANNLAAEHLRLVILADKVPVETQRIIEFVNRQMAATDVYAVEVAQFVGGDVRALNARVLNPSITDSDRKTEAGKRAASARWTRERFYEALAENVASDVVAVVRRIDNWAAAESHVEISFGTGSREGSMILIFHPAEGLSGSYKSGRDAVFMTLWTYGNLEVDFQYFAGYGSFRDPAKRLDLARRLSAIGCPIPEDRIDKRPAVPLSVLAEGDRLKDFFTVAAWLVASLKGGKQS